MIVTYKGLILPVVDLKNENQQKIPRIGNYREHVNVRYGHSRESKSYKITLIININSQFPELTVMENLGFVLCKSANLGLALVYF